MNEQEANPGVEWAREDDSRLKRIEELRKAIAAGTYQVPVERLAESMILFARGRPRMCGQLYS